MEKDIDPFGVLCDHDSVNLNFLYYTCNNCGSHLLSLDVDKKDLPCLHCKNGKYEVCECTENFYNFENVDHPTVSC